MACTVCSRYRRLSAIVTISMFNLRTNCTLGLAYGLLVGIGSAQCIVLSVSLIFLHELEQEYRRKHSCRRSLKHDNGPKRSIETTAQGQSMRLSSCARSCMILDLLGNSTPPALVSWACSSPITCHIRRKPSRELTISWKESWHAPSHLLEYQLPQGNIATDPYFWGYTDYDPPGYIRYYLPSRFSLPGIDSIRTYPMFVAFAVLYVAVELNSTVGVLLFVNILVPSLAGTWGEEWAYSPQYGDLDSICTRGLQGSWGTWRHQMFRSTLVSLTDAVTNKLQVSKKASL